MEEKLINMEEKLIIILKKCDLSYNNIEELENVRIRRDKLLNNELYEKVKKDIMSMKKIVSSSSYTCLQKNPEKKQKWPLVNFMRQIFKYLNYKMLPVRVCDGYTNDGKKKYIRYYQIKKIEEVKNIEIEELTNFLVIS